MTNNNSFEAEKNEQVSRRSFLGKGALSLGAMALAGNVFGQTKIPVAPNPDKANPNGRFAGKVVLITGATSGIGEGTAYAFAKEGAKVFFCGRREDLGKQVEAKIKKFGGEATYFKADVRNEAEVKNFVDACVKKYGKLDIAFNNAGIESPKAVPIAEQTLADFENVMRTNATGVFLSMKYELPYLLKNGGAIINNSSVSGHAGWATIAPYNASKHAVVSLTKVAALEYADKNIRVNAISPGAVDTPMLRRAMQSFNLTEQQIFEAYPIKRLATVEEMARAVMFLASDEATVITGTDVDVTGGYLTK
jgi:NAD(P)-dependent dehydrogenase (short-subunit alcohol dehydrogenase family)